MKRFKETYKKKHEGSVEINSLHLPKDIGEDLYLMTTTKQRFGLLNKITQRNVQIVYSWHYQLLRDIAKVYKEFKDKEKEGKDVWFDDDSLEFLYTKTHNILEDARKKALETGLSNYDKVVAMLTQKGPNVLSDSIVALDKERDELLFCLKQLSSEEKKFLNKELNSGYSFIGRTSTKGFTEVFQLAQVRAKHLIFLNVKVLRVKNNLKLADASTFIYNLEAVSKVVESIEKLYEEGGK